MSIVAELGDRIMALKPEEARDLRQMMNDRWGIVPAGGPPKIIEQETEGGLPPAPPEPTEFAVTLTDFPEASKLGLIKLVRELTGKSLKDAKDSVESKQCVVAPSADKAKAADLKAQIEAAGGTATVTPAA